MDTTPENPAQILVIDDNHGEVQELREALTECGETYELSVYRMERQPFVLSPIIDRAFVSQSPVSSSWI
jgi:GTP-dependent phosphoenolpyruvate carboxykinase